MKTQEVGCRKLRDGNAGEEAMRTNSPNIITACNSDCTFPRKDDIEKEISWFDLEHLLSTQVNPRNRRLVKNAIPKRTDPNFSIVTVGKNLDRSATEWPNRLHRKSRSISRNPPIERQQHSSRELLALIDLPPRLFKPRRQRLDPRDDPLLFLKRRERHVHRQKSLFLQPIPTRRCTARAQAQRLFPHRRSAEVLRKVSWFKQPIPYLETRELARDVTPPVVLGRDSK